MSAATAPSTPVFILSAFGDEIDPDLATQLDVLATEGIHCLELRSAWGRNVLDLDHHQLSQAKSLLDAYGFTVSAIGSPIGKSTLDEPPGLEFERLERAFIAAAALGTRLIRIFSYFSPRNGGPIANHRDEVLARLQSLAARASDAGYILLHENEKDIYGDTATRCHDLLATLNSPALRSAFDPANFVQVGVRPMAEAWPLLADYTTHIHIKDAVFSDGGVRPAGDGDGDVPALLSALVARGYQGYLTLEPHLQFAGPAGGYSGAEGMRMAARALLELLAPYRSYVTVR